jgi:hypothetical protein
MRGSDSRQLAGGGDGLNLAAKPRSRDLVLLDRPNHFLQPVHADFCTEAMAAQSRTGSLYRNTRKKLHRIDKCNCQPRWSPERRWIGIGMGMGRGRGTQSGALLSARRCKHDIQHTTAAVADPSWSCIHTYIHTQPPNCTLLHPAKCAEMEILICLYIYVYVPQQ